MSAHRLAHRPVAHPGRLGALGVGLPHCVAALPGRHPQRQLGPRLDLVVEQELVVDPGEPGVAAGGLDAVGRASWPIVVLPVGAVALKVPAVPRSTAVEHERRQVAGVDQLHRYVGVARGEHLAAARDPAQPPGQPADVLVRAEDQPGPRDRRPVAEDLGHRALAAGLQHAVVAVVGARRRDAQGCPSTSVRRRPAPARSASPRCSTRRRSAPRTVRAAAADFPTTRGTKPQVSTTTSNVRPASWASAASSSRSPRSASTPSTSGALCPRLNVVTVAAAAPAPRLGRGPAEEGGPADDQQLHHLDPGANRWPAPGRSPRAQSYRRTAVVSGVARPAARAPAGRAARRPPVPAA